MKALLIALAVCALPCFTQTPGMNRALTQERAQKLLTFEDEHTGTMPAGWGSAHPGSIAVDDKIVHTGKWSVRLERNADSAHPFSVIGHGVPISFEGSRIELRGYLRTEDVSEFAGLWMREDGEKPNLALENMAKRGLKGTTGWNEYSIELPLLPDATHLTFGVLISGTGTMWADDLQLLVDGKPIWEAPPRREPETVLTRDHEFDSESKIALTDLTPAQIDSLAVLGKVWGFLKYHHPRVTAGEVHWDYELFRVLPAVLGAADGAGARKELQNWVARLGPVKACERCAFLNSNNRHLRPQLDWLTDTRLLGSELSQSLRAIHHNRPVDAKQFYVFLTPNVSLTFAVGG